MEGIREFFCKHEWKLLSETVTKSKYEVAMEPFMGNNPESIHIPSQLCDTSRKHIQNFSCKRCGKLKRFVEVI